MNLQLWLFNKFTLVRDENDAPVGFEWEMSPKDNEDIDELKKERNYRHYDYVSIK